MIDLHTHHERCGHAEGSLKDVAGWAMARGIAVLGVSDHAPCLGDPSDQPRQHTQMARSAWDGYLAEAAALRVGLDFVLGSVHEVAHDGGLWSLFDPDSYAGADLDELHARYWRSVAVAAVSGLFDVRVRAEAAHGRGEREQLPEPDGYGVRSRFGPALVGLATRWVTEGVRGNEPLRPASGCGPAAATSNLAVMMSAPRQGTPWLPSSSPVGLGGMDMS